MISIKSKVPVKVQSRLSDFELRLSCLVIPKITGSVPTVRFNVKLPPNIVMADPTYNVPDDIDILIGCQNFWNIILGEQIRLSSGPILRETHFGWLISGPLPGPAPKTHVQCNFLEVKDQLQKFWEVEESVVKASPYSAEERDCESLFVKTTTKLSDGHFMVRLPLKGETSLLGASKEIATRRFLSLERKFQKNPELKRDYCDFMREYLALGHMTKLNAIDPEGIRYFIPHHPVIKLDSLTTKVRVVFDASCKTSTNVSLNDLQMTGPKLQQDLFDIVVRFRGHRVALTADVTKMYRQVAMCEDHRPLQSILWRFDPKDELDTYELNTVTYGTTAASFLAVRCLHQAALDQADMYPEASSTILSDFFVDDLLTGGESIEQVVKLKNKIVEILNPCGFPLRKWVSNRTEVFDGMDPSIPMEILPIGKNENTKTLGLLWNPNADKFQYSINLESTDDPTKRSMLSHVAQIFDPMGLLAPVTVVAKVLIQKLWQSGVEWDKPLPQDIRETWIRFCSELHFLNQISIPRCVVPEKVTRVEIHGFSDASEAAYGACVYMRCIDGCGQVTIRLICSKSKVSPLKTLTIPRLELCAALILARLVDRVRTTLRMKIDSMHFWCDSAIVLSWIGTAPNLLKIFVGNRVAEIQQLCDVNDWHHVVSSENPADVLSRGVGADKLGKQTIWWNGPEWLSDVEFSIPEIQPQSDLPELRRIHFWAAYVPCDSQHKDAVQLTLEQIDVIRRFTELYHPRLTLCTSSEDIKSAYKRHQLCSLIGVEGGHSLAGSLAVLRTLYHVGVRYLTLTSTCNTPWADCSHADMPGRKPEHGGLTSFGKSVVKEMNRLGMIVDLSHVSIGTMRDALDVSKAPVIFSHSSAHALCNSTRNVPDATLRKLALNKGVVMVNFYTQFLTCKDVATVADAVAHINHIREVAGVDNVGLGAGYDGINYVPQGLEDVSSYPTLFAELIGTGKWSVEDLKKLAGLNFLRVLQDVEKIRDEFKKANVPPYEDVLLPRPKSNCTSQDHF